MFETVGSEERAGMETLAWRVRNELAAAGLPVLAPGMDSALIGGAEVSVDDGADAGGGVFVGWSASPRLRACTSRTFGLKLLDDPLLRHSSVVGAAMMQAMMTVLASAGYTVEDANDEYRSHELRVVRGPGPGVPPMWAVRDEELAMPGWETGHPGQGRL
jgi:hypothetical protein